MSGVGVLLAGFAGLGTQDHQRQMYLPALRAHHGFTVVGVYDASSDGPGPSVADELDVPFFSDLDAAVAMNDADLVSLCCPLRDRPRDVAVIAQAGRHLLVDKPVARSSADAAAIADTIASAGVVCVPGHHHRYQAMVRSARAAVAAGRVGLPWNVQADFLVAGGVPCSVGELTNFALYPIDVVRALTGLEVQRVHAYAANHWQGSDATPEDFAILCLDLEHGCTSTIAVGRTRALTDLPAGAMGVHRYRISGSHGFLVADSTRPAARVRTSIGVRTEWSGGDSMQGLLDELHGAIASGRPADVGPADAWAAIRIVDAAQESISAGRPVTLALAEREALR